MRKKTTTFILSVLLGTFMSLGVLHAAEESGVMAISVSADDAQVSGDASAEGADVDADAAAPAAGAEEPVVLNRPTHDRFNLHLGVGYVYGIDYNNDFRDDTPKGYRNQGIQGLVGFDIVLIEPLALSFQGGFNSFVGGTLGKESLTSAFIGAGLRLRFFASNRGPLSDGGSAAGNLWLDAHFSYINHAYEDHGGYDIGLGYEFAFFKNINIGPYVRFQHAVLGGGIQYMAIAAGLAMSIAGDTTPRDMDGDGVPDDQDNCPTVPGPAENGGCPILDRDNDGIHDEHDRCPDAPGIPETVGCPPIDPDGDGSYDHLDACPDEPGLPEHDGCPPPDVDGDGIPDHLDACPDEPGTPEYNGCPPTDRDGDGVFDHLDACPDEPGIPENDGCPSLIKVVDDEIKILQKVQFATGKSTILKESFELLDQVRAVIASKPEIRVQVEGHTDNVGRDAKNMKLSQQRADSVKAHLVKNGIADERLEAVGKGPHVPVGDNKTEEGRESNRRVEFHIIKPEPAPEEAPAEAEGDAQAEGDAAKAEGDAAK